MKTACQRLLQASLFTLVGASVSVTADTTSATCKFYHKGDHKKEASGPCQFSQRQGYIDIRLRNGKQFSLSPHGEANHYRDQKGHKVKRRMEGDTQVYKWDQRAIHVSFDGGSHSGDKYHSGHHEYGNTPRDLQDLVGARGGMAEDQLRDRGYVLANSSKSGQNAYSNWHHKHGGQCVSIHTVDGHYRSIVYAPPFDCQ